MGRTWQRRLEIQLSLLGRQRECQAAAVRDADPQVDRRHSRQRSQSELTHRRIAYLV